MNKQTKTNYTATLKNLFLLILAFTIVYKLPIILVQMKTLADGIILWGGSIGLVLAFLYLVSDANADIHQKIESH